MQKNTKNIQQNATSTQYSIAPVSNHNHDGINSNFLPLSSIINYFPQVTSIPTATPGKFGKSLAFDTTVSVIYYYDFTNKEWRQTSSATLSSISESLGVFGDGSDGNADITGSSQTISPWLTLGVMQRDAYLNNLTIETSGVLKPNGYKLFVAGTLTIQNGGQIQQNGGGGGNGVAGQTAFPSPGSARPGSAGGTAGIATNTAGSVGASNAGQVGTASATGTAATNSNGPGGTAGLGSLVSSNSLSTANSGGSSGASGAAGGNGSQSGGGAGAAGAGAACTVPTYGIHKLLDYIRFLEPNSLTPTSYALYTGSPGGAGGAGGAGGNGVAGGVFGSTGGGGGGGGAAGGNIVIYVNTLINNVAGGIQAVGGPGGNGGNGGNGFTNTGSAGGGGGGAGGNGGLVIIFYATKSGTGTIDVSGASGGTGGSPGNIGSGTSVVGQAGSQGFPGNAGTIAYIQI